MPADRTRWVVPIATVLIALCTGTASGQEATVPSLVYEREVYQYAPAGRPDPFRSLLNGELGVRIEDLSLSGVIYHPDPTSSVAILSQVGTTRRMQVRVGERLGSVRVLSIRPDEVEVVVEELGVSRREVLRVTPSQPQRGP